MKLEEEIQQRKFKNDYQKLAVNILYTSNWLSSNIESLLKQAGVTMQQFNVLRILRGQKSQPCSIKTIKERMLDKMSDASRIVDKLIAKKLVSRKQCPNDRRSVDVIITEKGLNLLQSIDHLDKDHEKLFKQLSKQEIQTLNTLLDKLRG